MCLQSSLLQFGDQNQNLFTFKTSFESRDMSPLCACSHVSTLTYLSFRLALGLYLW